MYQINMIFISIKQTANANADANVDADTCMSMMMLIQVSEFLEVHEILFTLLM